MAKELPYFKFEPNEWENGNIQILSHEEKGVFIDLCSIYWQRLGELPYKLALQKVCKGNATALDSLYEEKIFDIIDGMICIDFLNEQLQEFENVSKQNSKNARDGWKKRRNHAVALRPHSEGNAIREEEIREDDSKVDKKIKILMSEANASNALPINQKYFETAKGFYELFKKNQTQLKVTWLHLEKTKVDDFIKPIRLMIESDKRDLEEIRKVWRFLKTDEFWMKNIQSTSKLREKFDQLITQAKNTKTNGTDQKHFSPISDNAFPSIQNT